MADPSPQPPIKAEVDGGNNAASSPTLSFPPELAPTTTSPLPVWLDCDPGHDDALALILAGYSPQLHILGVSTVAGNQSIEKTTVNALNVLAVSGLEHLPVHQGRDQPILRKGVACPEIHGTSGLEGPHFPPLALKASPTKAFEAMGHAIRRSAAEGKPVTILATGPLTNVALLLLTHPELASPQYIHQIVLMGGAVGVGNTGAAAEFNIQVDPEAASIVFESGVPVVMVPLEVTHTALVTEGVLERIREINSPFAHFIIDLMLFFRAAYRDVFGFSSPPLHDPCAVAYLLRPDLFTSRLMRVDIDYESRLCFGRTVCDVYGRDPRSKNVRVCLKMQAEPFWDLMLDSLKKANEKSVLNKEGEGREMYVPTTCPQRETAENNGAPREEQAGPLGASLQNFPM